MNWSMPENRKILLAYLVRPAEGGMKQHLLALLRGLNRERFESVVLCPPDASLADEAAKLGIRVIPVPIAGELNPRHDLRAAGRVRAILRELRPDILHIHSTKAGLVGRLALVGMRRPKVILTVHSFVFDERVGQRKRALVSWLERRLARYTDRIVAVSQALKDELVAAMGLPPALISVIHNGIPFGEPPIPLPTHVAPCIGTVARLAPQKGVDCFLQTAALVAARFPQATFPIIGDGPLKEPLMALADELGIAGRVEFLGHRTDVPALLREMDVFVLASTYETFGLTVVEALSQQTPVVASRVGGIPEIITDGETGLLASSGNPADFAEKICRLLDNPAFALRLARQGDDEVRTRFSSARMLAETEQLYHSLWSADC